MNLWSRKHIADPLFWSRLFCRLLYEPNNSTLSINIQFESSRFYTVGDDVYCISKIKLVGYQQWRVPIGWTTIMLSSDSIRVLVNQSTNRMVAAESRFGEDHSCSQWNQTDYPFPDIEIFRK